MRISFFVIGLLFVVGVEAQKRKKLTRVEYINMYKGMAMEEMSRTGIPASITLAQGVLESGDGNSTLAVKANNHFGIKCHDWKGPSVRHDDDAKNECFRKYKSAEQSYKDHSDFLTRRGRYAALFELKQDDYKGWAKGLKKAGYATSPTYAKALIGIVEDNQLYKYDALVLASKGNWQRQGKKEITSGVTSSGRKILYNNRVKYVVADSGDTYASIAEELSLFSWQLPRYNEAELNGVLKSGDFVYLQPKRNRTYAKKKTHKVLEGETVQSISQKYGIKGDKLRQRNNIPEGLEPTPGSQILLKGKLKGENAPSTLPGKKKEILKEQPSDNNQEFQIEYDLGG